VSTTAVPPERRVRDSRLAWGILALLSLVAFVLFYRKGLGTTFYYDEWNFVMNRRGWDADTFLRAHNEHFSLVPVLIFKLLFATVGLDSYGVYRVLLLVAHLTVVALLFVYARRRVGDWLALVVAVPVLFLGAAWNDLLVPFQLGFVIPVACGIGALLALDRRDLTGDVVACVLLVLAIASSGVGIAFVAAVLVETLLRSDRWRALWIPGIPIVLYGLWSLNYGDPTATAQGRTLYELFRDNLPAVPGYAATAIAGSVGAVIGIGLDWGRPLALAGVIALAVWLARGRFSPRLLALLAAGAAYWGLGAIFRAHLNAPVDSRYLYLGAILVLLIALELVPPVPLTWPFAAVAAVLVGAAALANFGALRDGSRYLQEWSRYVGVELAALELAGPSTDPAFRPDPPRAPDITAGKYFEAIDQYGSPATEVSEIWNRAEPERAAADAVLLGALALKAVPASGGSLCRRLGTHAAAQPSPEGMLVRASEAPVEIRLALFGPYPEAPFATVPARSARTLRIPALDGVRVAAQLKSTEPFEVCAP
jgi:hypothetical protein